jgi:hypothetical protein
MTEENNITNQSFPLSFNSYAAFDATSLKTLMQQRLIDGGVFTDQIFEGSNFNSLLDVIAYSYHVLLFYLNKTANESSFSNAQLYENVNRIVKLLNYNPTGIQTSVLSFSAIASNSLQEAIYTIPRYAYFSINDTTYSFTEDLTFAKSTSGVEVLNDLNDSALIYQGSFIQYPIYLATGEEFEEFTIVSVDIDGNNDLIDHNFIHVYVKSGNNSWKEYKSVNSLYLENPLSESYELRLNENQRYTIRFGNGVTGKKLNIGDFVAVYYLKSDGPNGEAGPNTLDGSRLFIYESPLYSEIMSQIRPEGIKILNTSEAAELNFVNTLPSSKFTNQEDSKSIKNNARNTYKTQYRLINALDFENYIKKNFSNLIQDVKVVNNNDYLENHLQYLNELGLNEPNLDSRILFNQVNFSNSCNFNNVYCYCIPKIPQNETANFNKFLSIGLKNKIKDFLNPIKILTSEIVFQDPVYLAVGLGVASSSEVNNNRLYPEIINETKLIVKKRGQSFVSNNLIVESIVNVFRRFFDDQKLGKKIDLENLSSSIYSINGVESFSTERTVDGQKITIDGLSMLSYNPVYSAPNEDIRIINQSLTLPFFKAPYYENYDVLKGNIVVV